jgi:hypothetical protein
MTTITTEQKTQPTSFYSQQSRDEHLIRKCFDAVNAFKRFRALEEGERDKGNTTKAEFYELQQFKKFDELELRLRALQNEIRGNNAE